MKVWIDQDLCTGDGLCEEIAPIVFTLLTTGSRTSRKATRSSGIPAAPRDSLRSRGQEEATIESAEECPGECIFIEVD